MNLFALASLSLTVASAILALIIFVGAKRKLRIIWGFMNVAITIFGLGTFMAGMAHNYKDAFFSWQIAFCGIPYIAVLFYHIVHEFCGLKSKRFLLFAHVHGALFALTSILTPWVVHDVKFLFGQFYYYQAHIVFNCFFTFWILIVAKGFLHLFNFIINSKGLKRTQGEYLFYGMIVGFGSGATTAIPSYGINIYPGWHFLVCVYCAIITYALFRYQVLDVKIVMTRFLVFVCVYLTVLGIPFGLLMWGKSWLITIVGENWAWVPMMTLLVFATAGPFIYLYFQRRAEDKLLQESRRIQAVLIKFSIGLSSVRQLQKLIKLIVSGLRKSLQLDFTGIYLLDQSNNEYILKLSEPILTGNTNIKSDHPLLAYLRDKKGPLLLDEMKHQFENEKKEKADGLKSTIELYQSLNGALVIPAIKDDIVLAFVVLGKGKVKEIYSREFLDVLTVVGNQIALAIENAVFYEETGKDWIQRAHDSRQKTMGEMSTGVAHQIRNRLHAISSQGLMLQDLFGGFDFKKATEEDFEQLRKEYSDAMGRIFKDIQRGEEICEGIKNYAKNTEGMPQVAELDKAVTDAMRMLNLARPKNINFSLVEDNTKDIKLWANFAMLSDMFFNMFDNSNDAIVSKKEAIKSGEIEKDNDDFKIKVRANPNGKMCEIVVEDNGKGVLPKHLEEDKGVNVMWFTTKGATKGTGMGVPFMRKFVEYNGGTFKIESEYTKWTRIIFTLPLATEEQVKSGGNRV